ncbi:30S ribosomal protein S16 [Candidatus Eisenbacteria bacterium]|uniref:Small ribosomal subunit protein bS16 n=1 Tax=Eiseniibacteriota bacterium TaxID=2212470 RepID=A0ABV6YJI4_UNCEI
MGVVVRLQRAGARHRPFYRIIVIDSRKARDGAFLEKLGFYDPLPDPEVIELDRERLAAWMSKGAKPSEAVAGLMKRHERRGAQAAPASEPSVEETVSAAPAVEAPGTEPRPEGALQEEASADKTEA